jgi:hypothetical protein
LEMCERCAVCEGLVATEACPGSVGVTSIHLLPWAT